MDNERGAARNRAVRRVAVRNMGCKLNTHEGEVIKQLLGGGGAFTVVPWTARADYYVLNTCSVTARADARARNYIRNAHRRAPGAKVIVTGCYAQTQGEDIARMPEVAAVVGNLSKEVEVPSIIERLESGDPVDRLSVGNIWTARTLEVPVMAAYPGLSRPYVKIQDGCNEICSFCKIPLARGRNRSQPVERVVEQVETFTRTGFEEVVFAGVHMGCYGEDLEPARTLEELIRAVLSRSPRLRVRLSSIEPNHTTLDLLDYIQDEPRVCRHLHLPMQSGHDRVLAAMRRRYTSADYASKVTEVLRRLPGVAIGADVIVGFPGETDDEFAHTAAFIQALPLAYLHVFPYSAREKTPAARMEDQVSEDVRARRAAVLREVSRKQWIRFREGQLGLDLEAVVIGEIDQEVPGASRRRWTRALTGNYIEVLLPETGLRPSKRLMVRVEALTEEGAVGLRCGSPV